jgi:hypothetical protein
LSVRRLITLGLLSTLPAACLWDPDFFDDYSEAGPEAPPPDAAPGADAASMADARPEAPSDRVGVGADCAGGACAAVAVYGTQLQITDLSADPSGGVWLLVKGDLTLIRSAETAHPLPPTAQSYLLHVTAGDFSVDMAEPLPFEATAVADAGNALYLAGRGLTPGSFLGTHISEGRSHIVARVVNQQPQWWVTWDGGPSGPFMDAPSASSVFVAGSPANASFFRERAAAPFQQGAHPGAPMSFLARFDGLGELEWFHPVGGGDTTIQHFAAGPSGQVAMSGLASSGGPLWDGSALPPSRFVLGAAPDGSLAWSRTWPFTDAVEPGPVAVGASGETWLLGQALGAQLGGLPVEPGSGAFLARVGPGGLVERATGSNGSRLRLDGVADTGAGALVLGQSPNEGAELGGLAVPGVGNFALVTGANANVEWMQTIGQANGNAGIQRRAAVGAQHKFLALDLDKSFEWGASTFVARPSEQMIGVLRFR